ncbi:GDSL esterase/lipase At4g26790-like [Phragmites australis]|uniref:GDSL esterase/lipase At4g26790-like n=1 Tax=Phragmites australis TaxID=29695 RepID=UPI002D793A2E|nr:GDSL esterase/lipase At4g26790-like [Phragmites australis]
MAAASRVRSSVALLLLPLLLLAPAPAVRARVTALIVFGDSTVDAGNNNAVQTVVRSNFPPYGRDFPGGRATGRFSNGRVATDFYSEALGLGRAFVPAYLDPGYGIRDFATGVCFASAGSGLDVATSRVFGVIPLRKQVDMFREYKARLADHLGAAEARTVVSDAVYAVSIGTNDFIENYFALTTTRFLEFTVDEYTDYLVGLARSFLAELYGLGARKIGLTGLGAMGCLPLERAHLLGRCAEEYNAAARGFNAALEEMVSELGAELPGAEIRVAAVYDFFEGIVRNPSRYGFARADVGCCGSGTYEMGYTCRAWDARTCADAGWYVFWDAVHPTERANRIIAEYLMNTTFAHFS